MAELRRLDRANPRMGGRRMPVARSEAMPSPGISRAAVPNRVRRRHRTRGRARLSAVVNAKVTQVDGAAGPHGEEDQVKPLPACPAEERSQIVGNPAGLASI